MHQVSNYLFDTNIQTVVYINIFLKIDILPTHFIVMHVSLFVVLILILIFYIGICSGEVINELQFNVLLLQQLIFKRFQVAHVINMNFRSIVNVSIFILVIELVLTFSILFNDNENKFNVILYLVTTATTTTYSELFINLFVFLIVVIFGLMLNENNIVVYHYIYYSKEFR